MKRSDLGVPVMALAITMLGCSNSSEPSAVEIAKLIQGEVNRNNFIEPAVKANYATLTIRKVGCKTQSDPTGVSVTACTIEQTAESPFNSTGATTAQNTIAMAKGKDGWEIYGMGFVPK